MSHYTSKPNYSPSYGHSYFLTAIDRAIEASSKHNVPADVQTDTGEAIRLYGVAIADAELGMEEIAADDDWAMECRGIVESMQWRVAGWRVVIKTLEGQQ